MHLYYSIAKKVVDAGERCFFYREHLEFLGSLRLALGHGAVPALGEGEWSGWSNEGHRISVAEYEAEQSSAFNKVYDPDLPHPVVVKSSYDDEDQVFVLTHETSQLSIRVQSSGWNNYDERQLHFRSPEMEFRVAGKKIEPPCLGGQVKFYCLKQGREAAEALERGGLGEYQARAYQRVFLAIFAHYWARGGGMIAERGEDGYDAAMYRGVSATFLDAASRIYAPPDDFVGYYPAVSYDETAPCGKKIRPVGRLYAVVPETGSMPQEISWEKFREILAGNRVQYGWYVRALG